MIIMTPRKYISVSRTFAPVIAILLTLIIGAAIWPTRLRPARSFYHFLYPGHRRDGDLSLKPVHLFLQLWVSFLFRQTYGIRAEGH